MQVISTVARHLGLSPRSSGARVRVRGALPLSRITLCLLVLGLAGCATVPRAAKDGAPLHDVDVSKIPNAVPMALPKSKYGNPAHYEVYGKRYHVKNSSDNYQERGIASWYGTKFHSKRTSSGEPYDLYTMTAAHKTLPLPTFVKVRNLENGREIIVKVNDRGPFHDNRIIDLSYVAAKKLGITPTGTGLVELTAINPNKPYAAAKTETRAISQNSSYEIATAVPVASAQAASPYRPHIAINNNEGVQTHAAPAMVAPVAIAATSTQTYPAPAHKPQIYLQLGAYANHQSALALKQRIAQMTNDPVRLEETLANNQIPVYRVQIGPLASVDASDQLDTKLAGLGLGQPMTVIK